LNGPRIPLAALLGAAAIRGALIARDGGGEQGMQAAASHLLA